MAKVILNQREKHFWINCKLKTKEYISNYLNGIAGELGGYGIDLVDDDGNDLSLDGFNFSYAEPGKNFTLGSRVTTSRFLKNMPQVFDKTRYRGVTGTIVRIDRLNDELCFHVFHDDDSTVGIYYPNELTGV